MYVFYVKLMIPESSSEYVPPSLENYPLSFTDKEERDRSKELELAVPWKIESKKSASGMGVSRAPRGANSMGITPAAKGLLDVDRAEDVYDPCFVLPLLDWGLRAGGVPAQVVSACLVRGL